MLAENPHVHFFDSRQRGYVGVGVTRDRMDTAFRSSPTAVSRMRLSRHCKRYVVETGKAGAVPA